MTRTTETGDRRAFFSLSALNRFLACEHRTYLDILERRGELRVFRLPPDMFLPSRRGDRHEVAVVDGLVAEGLDVVSLDDEAATVEERARRTIAAIREGRGVLHQGCLARDGWLGYPDFLIRIDEPSDLGAWSYEVYDAKLGSHPQPRHISTCCSTPMNLWSAYRVGVPTECIYRLGDGGVPAFGCQMTSRPTRRAFVPSSRIASRSSPAWKLNPAYPYKVSECQFCHWWKVCTDRRRADDHVSLVANLNRAQGLKLEAARIHSVGDVAGLDEAATIPRDTRDAGNAASAGIDSDPQPVTPTAALRATRARGRPRPRPSSRAIAGRRVLRLRG